MRGAVAIVVTVLVVVLAPATAGAAYDPKEPPLDTPWTRDVSTRLPLPDYPRPQLRRSPWRNLNGRWQFAAAGEGEAPPFGRKLAETVLVPYPLQSALSGIMRYEPRSWYRRTFRVPDAWGSRRVILNFGAVTHEATVYVNGRRVGFHKGSYDAFSLDITSALRRGERNELIVGVFDDIVAGGQPTGKQFPISASVFFTASTGIWQTVWLEPVRSVHVTRLDLRPDPERERLLVTVRARAPAGTKVVVRARDGGRVVATQRGRPRRSFALKIDDPKLWTPDRPFLYDLDVELRRGSEVVDRIDSYFGMRSIDLERVGGVTRAVLNGEFVFQSGTLDQGYWPDGVYTAPTDEALRFDLAAHTRLGFNMVRKHIKVEPQRWYYWADRLGLLVWQDMPSMPIYRRVEPKDERQFERELREMIDEHRSSPSIVSWIAFNEGWGEFDVSRITGMVERYDPSRLANGHSGAANCCATVEPRNGDVRDTHLYTGPFAVAPDFRATVIGEFGGYPQRTPGNEWKESTPTVTPDNPSTAAHSGQLRRLWDALALQMRTPGLSGAVYTELTDVERELAGLITYDRRVFKVDVPLLRRLNTELIDASRTPDGVRPEPGTVPAGAAGLWTFDEGEGATARDTGGGGRDLALQGGAGWTDGIAGRALQVRGGGERARAAGPALDTRGSFTVSAWIRHDDREQSATAVSQDGGTTSGFSLGLLFAPERPEATPGYFDQPAPINRTGHWWTWAVPRAEGCPGTECATRANTAYDEGRFDPAPGTWHHVVGAVDRANRTMTLYIDGHPVDNRILETVVNATGPFTIGAGQRMYAGSDSFNGAIDQVRTYARALSAAEVWGLYAAESR